MVVSEGEGNEDGEGVGWLGDVVEPGGDGGQCAAKC